MAFNVPFGYLDSYLVIKSWLEASTRPLSCGILILENCFTLLPATKTKLLLLLLTPIKVCARPGRWTKLPSFGTCKPEKNILHWKGMRGRSCLWTSMRTVIRFLRVLSMALLLYFFCDIDLGYKIRRSHSCPPRPYRINFECSIWVRRVYVRHCIDRQDLQNLGRRNWQVHVGPPWTYRLNLGF